MDLKYHLVPTSLPWTGTPFLRPGFSTFYQPNLNTDGRGGGVGEWVGTHNLPGQPGPVSHHLHGEEFVSNI